MRPANPSATRSAIPSKISSAIVSMFLTAFLAVLAALPAAAIAGEPLIRSQDFEPALQRLVERNTPGSFLIIQEAGTGKFVQFSHHPENGLALDLPVDGLSEAEQSRASLHLIGQGGEFLSWEVDGHRIQAYHNRLRRDVAAAARLATTVMQEVYGFGPEAVYTLVEQ